MKVLDVVNTKDVPFRLILVPEEEAGPNPLRKPAHQRATVEFYDSRYRHTEHGQFVSDYYPADLLTGSGGLILFGNEPDWIVDGQTMDLVRAWLAHHLQRQEITA